ncbi:MAG: hypothetical protein HKN56_04415 [Gammaproteobacteria bacterium]|nr:hypothetical protein [Gammaproteobacteria bacterium]
MISSIAQIVVGVADLTPVRRLWCQHFGLETVAERHGSDPVLENIWGLPEGGISGQLLLRSPGEQTGWLHFVEFTTPARPVRENAATTALCPKNIDINCIDMPRRVAELKAAGFSFRSEVSEYQIDGLTVREVQMPAHDAINVVLIEVPEWDMEMTGAGFSGVTSFVATVSDLAAEARFFSALFSHEELLQHRITGPEIEAVVGLPPGSALDMRVLGDPVNLYGRVELVAYTGIDGDNLYPGAIPPATGSLAVRFAVAGFADWQRRAERMQLDVTHHGDVELLFGRVTLATVRSPTGLMVDVFAPV